MIPDSKIKHICIVGGGSSGWISALALLNNTKDIKISLVESPDIDKNEVGEATVPSVTEQFESLLGLDEKEWMSECSATYKTTIRFSNFHSKGKHDTFYHPFFDEDPDWPLYAYNLDVSKFSIFCKNIAIKRGLNYILDTVGEVKLDKDNYIKELICSSNKIEADYFIDATGFNSLLIEKTLKDKFVSVNDYLLNDSAIYTHLPYKDKERELITYVDCVGLNAGWSWRISMWDKYSVGYVYSSKFITKEEAEKEFREYLKVSDVEFKSVPMKCGYHQNPWLNNCVSIGLATGFVEPLESTGIMLILKGIGGFVWHLNNSDNEPVKSNIETYNKNMLWTINGIIDFIQAHFVLTSREDTSYWKHVKYSTPIREELSKILDKLKLNEAEDSSGHYFPPTSWRCILSGMQADVSSQYRYVKDNIYDFKLLDCVMDFEKWKPAIRKSRDWEASEEYMRNGVTYFRVEELDDEMEIKLQNALDIFNDELDYHGMWDMEDVKWRLDGDDWILHVMEKDDKIIGWCWDILKKLSVYFNKTNGLVYNLQEHKKNEFKFITDIFIESDEVFGGQFYVEKQHRGRKLSSVMLVNHPKVLEDLGFKKLIFHIEGWNEGGASLAKDVESALEIKKEIFEIK